MDKKLIDALYAPAVAIYDTADGVDQAVLQRLIGWKNDRFEKGSSKEDREDLRALLDIFYFTPKQPLTISRPMVICGPSGAFD